MTVLRRLPPLSGCHVRRRQASSAALDMESLRDQPEVEAVGEDSKLLLPGDNAPELDEFRLPAPNAGRPRAAPWGDWNGLPPEGTLRRRPGVRMPGVYILCDRECEDEGDAIPDPHRGLFWPVEKVADVGVLKSLGDTGRYENWLSGTLG
jgi:hypothetical protein